MDLVEPKGRRLWRRILLFPLTRFVAALVALWLGYVLHLIVSHLLAIPPDARPLLLVAALGGAYVGYVRAVERRPAREVSWQQAPRELGLGLAVGAGLISAIVLCLWAVGSYRVVGVNPGTVAVLPLYTMAAVAIWEEVVFRGIVFRILEEGLGTWMALIASALLFGLLHLGNENASLLGSLTIAATAGLLLAGAYVLTRRLWLAIGLHYGVNAAQGPVLGLPVSGHPSEGLVESTTHGPVLLTGGAFGIEASLLMATLGVALAAYVLRSAHVRGRFVPPLWHPTRRNLDQGGVLEDLS